MTQFGDIFPVQHRVLPSIQDVQILLNLEKHFMEFFKKEKARLFYQKRNRKKSKKLEEQSYIELLEENQQQAEYITELESEIQSLKNTICKKEQEHAAETHRLGKQYFNLLNTYQNHQQRHTDHVEMVEREMRETSQQHADHIAKLELQIDYQKSHIENIERQLDNKEEEVRRLQSPIHHSYFCHCGHPNPPDETLFGDDISREDPYNDEPMFTLDFVSAVIPDLSVPQTRIKHFPVNAETCNQIIQLILNEPDNLSAQRMLEQRPDFEDFTSCFYSLVNQISSEIGMNLWCLCSWKTNAMVIVLRFGILIDGD